MIRQGPIVIAGAGAIGCFIGGVLAGQGKPVTLLSRPRVLQQIDENGLTLTGYDGFHQHVPATELVLTDSDACLADAQLILVTVKSADTATVAQQIAAQAPETVTVISLQNGLDAAATLRRMLPAHDVRAGMVPFNVVPGTAATYHRATSGDIVIGSGPGDVASLLSTDKLLVRESDDIAAIQWGKLVINLNNALNALSGLTLQAQLLDRDWRRIMAAQISEALSVLRAHHIHPVSTTPLPSRAIPWVLRLPTPLFSRVAAKMLTIDPYARTSMAYDLAAGKPTEIDALQGLIISMGRDQSVPTPLSLRVAECIKQAEAAGKGCPDLRPDALI